MSLALVYLARGKDGGLAPINNFFNAYITYPAGCAHELVVIAKGWDNVDELNQLKNTCSTLHATMYELPDDGYDWGAYMRLMPIIQHDWVCFINTNSRPLVNGWLNILYSTVTSPDSNISMAGATGSWGTYSTILPTEHEKKKYNNYFMYTLRLLKNMFLFIGNIYDFPMFPNPHIRSNSFIIKTSLFREYINSKRIPSSKREACILESGRNNLTRYVLSRGLKAVVVGKDQNIYESCDFNESKTFRVSNQENLIVEDNQTRDFKKSSLVRKGILHFSAWGNNIKTEPK